MAVLVRTHWQRRPRPGRIGETIGVANRDPVFNRSPCGE
jgi:hypothetical protein